MHCHDQNMAFVEEHRYEERGVRTAGGGCSWRTVVELPAADTLRRAASYDEG
jgi:hypothetical protein